MSRKTPRTRANQEFMSPLGIYEKQIVRDVVKPDLLHLRRRFKAKTISGFHAAYRKHYRKHPVSYDTFVTMLMKADLYWEMLPKHVRIPKAA